jgi:hypothetical protein
MKADRTGVVTIPLESSVAPKIFFLIGAGAAALGLVLLVGGVSSESNVMAGVIPLGIGAPIALLALSSWRAGPLRLVVDVPAGMIHHTRGSYKKSCALDALGSLVVEKYSKRSGASGSQNRYLDWYKLRAPGLDTVIVDTPYEASAERMRERLDAFVAQSAVRSVLVVSPLDGDAFRDAPRIEEQLRVRVHEPERLRRALATLTDDPEPDVRAKAGQLSARATGTSG